MLIAKQPLILSATRVTTLWLKQPFYAAKEIWIGKVGMREGKEAGRRVEGSRVDDERGRDGREREQERRDKEGYELVKKKAAVKEGPVLPHYSTLSIGSICTPALKLPWER